MVSLDRIILSGGFVALVVSGLSWIGISARGRNEARLKAEINHAVAMGEAGRYGEAKDALAKIVKEEPDNVDALFNFGLAAWGSGDLQAAEHTFVRIGQLAPTDYEASAELAGLYCQLGEHAKALDLLEKVPVGAGNLAARLRGDSRFESLDEEPRMKAIYAKHGIHLAEPEQAPPPPPPP